MEISLDILVKINVHFLSNLVPKSLQMHIQKRSQNGQINVFLTSKFKNASFKKAELQPQTQWQQYILISFLLEDFAF